MLTRYGFVHVFDTGSPLENTAALRRRVESGEVAGPAIHTAGMVLFPQGGTPPEALTSVLGFMPTRYPEVGTAAQAVELVNATLDAGADAIKLYAKTWFGTPVAMAPELSRAITDAAHQRGKLVLAHPTDLTGLGRSVEAGVDVLVHTAPEGGPWSSELIAAMKRKTIALIPTLKLWRYETRHLRRSLVQGLIDQGVAQLRAYAAAGGTILFGTDVGYMADYDPTEEYEMMAGAGLDFAQILASLTTAPAERFGRGDRTGRIAVGMDADLVVLRGDPVADIRSLSAVRYAIRRGAVVYHAR
jgi:imidazolonepropionase-like amidohydrolase